MEKELASIITICITYFIEHIKDIAALCLGLGTVHYYIRLVLKRLQPYTNITDNVATISKEIKEIKKELTFNSGTSLKDLVNQIKFDVKSNTELTTTILNRQRWMLDNRTEPIFETNKDGKFTWVNDAFMKLTDRGFKDLKDNNWVNILKEEIRNDIANDWYLAVASKRNFEHNAIIVDAKNNNYLSKIIAHRQEDGNYIGTLMEIKKA
jgi:PAS domain-containing protein